MFTFLKYRIFIAQYTSSVQFISRPRPEGWSHHGRTFTPLISVVCHSDWSLHAKFGPRADVVYPSRTWSSSPTSTGHCSLRNLFSGNFLVSRDVTKVYASFLAFTNSTNSRVMPAVFRTRLLFVFFVVQETRRILLKFFISKAPRRFSSFFRSFQLW